MDLQSLQTACQIGLVHNDSAVKAACAEQGLVQNFRTVGGRKDNNTLGGIKTVNFRQKLIQGLLPFIVAAVTVVAAFADGIDLIDEDNGRSLLGGLLEQITYTACANAHKHLHKVRTGDKEEGDTGFTGNGFCQQSLTGTGRTNQQSALGDLCADGGILLRIVEEIDDLLQRFLGFILSGHISEGDTGFLFHVYLCLALADGHTAAHLAAHIAHQEAEEQEDQGKGNHIGKQNGNQEGIFLFNGAVIVHILLVELLQKQFVV